MRRSSTDANALSMRSGTVGADTLEPQRISKTSSILRVETLARHVSIMASSTEVPLLR